jgi:hypothetical protein
MGQYRTIGSMEPHVSPKADLTKRALALFQRVYFNSLGALSRREQPVAEPAHMPDVDESF